MEAAVVEHLKPLTPQQANALREKVKELQDKRAAARTVPGRKATGESPPSTNVTWTAEDERMIREIRERLAAFQRRPMNPAIAEMVTVRIALAKEAELSERELRLGTPQGLSNPLVFWVGQLPEFREPAETNRSEPRVGPEARVPPSPLNRPPDPGLRIRLPAIVERFHKTLKGECIRPKTPLSLNEARILVAEYVIY